MKRTYDPKNEYIEGVLKEYNHWIVEVSFRQHTLGNYIIFAKRNIEKIYELKNTEILELKTIMNEIEKAITKAFRPDKFNYLQLGNKLHHLHFHCIPRYKKPRNFAGRKWTDKAWGKPPIWKYTVVKPKIIKKINNTIKLHLTT